MKLLAFLLVIFAAPLASAEGNCVSQPGKGAHEGFCNNQNSQTCGAHSALCTWEKHKVKTMQIIGKNSAEEFKVIEKTTHGCVAQDGKEAHSGFCKSHNKMACEAHSSVCTWE